MHILGKMSLQAQLSAHAKMFEDIGTMLPKYQNAINAVLSRLPPETACLARVRIATYFVPGELDEEGRPFDAYPQNLKPERLHTYVRAEWPGVNSKPVVLEVGTRDLSHYLKMYVYSGGGPLVYTLSDHMPFERIAAELQCMLRSNG